jgi:hypothetical protein
VMVVGAVVLGLGMLPANAPMRVWMVAAGAVVLLAGVAIMVALNLLIKIESHSFRFQSQQVDLHDAINRQQAQLERLVENSMLSDAARSLANRDRECEALRSAIRADLRIERWDAALKLIDEMADRFGYAEEADGLRTEANEARVEAMRRKLHEAKALIEQQLGNHEWDKARGEIERLEKALPDEPRIARLRGLYNQKFSERKQELLQAWNNAVGRNDVDQAIDVLQELDTYLTRAEARSLEESARGVFKAKLLQLGMQFQFAVSEKRWRDALEVGVQIMDEFPNSRMSKEVAEAIDGLRARAGLHGDVEVTTAAERGAAQP